MEPGLVEGMDGWSGIRYNIWLINGLVEGLVLGKGAGRGLVETSRRLAECWWRGWCWTCYLADHGLVEGW